VEGRVEGVEGRGVKGEILKGRRRGWKRRRRGLKRMEGERSGAAFGGFLPPVNRRVHRHFRTLVEGWKRL
jgi:hypothetical protein